MPCVLLAMVLALQAQVEPPTAELFRYAPITPHSNGWRGTGHGRPLLVPVWKTEEAARVGRGLLDEVGNVPSQRDLRAEHRRKMALLNHQWDQGLVELIEHRGVYLLEREYPVYQIRLDDPSDGPPRVRWVDAMNCAAL